MKMNKLILCGVWVVFLYAGSECFAAARKPANFEGETTGHEQSSAQTQKKSEGISETRPKKLAGSEKTKQKKQIIAEGQEIRFLDEDSRLLKKISLENKEEYKTREGKKYKTIKRRRASISANNQHAVIVENERDGVLITETGEEKQLGETAKIRGKLFFYDGDGQMIFEKKYSEGRRAGKIVISNSGVTAVLADTDGINEYAPVVYAYDKNGVELLEFPANDENEKPNDIDNISSNGRYIAVRSGYPITAVFFDLQNKTSWKADKDYIAYEISDDGIAELGYQLEPVVTVDLKQYLGK